MDESEALYCLICGGPFCDANDVMSKKRTRWTRTLCILGRDGEAPGTNQCFLALGVAVEPSVIEVNLEASRDWDENADKPLFDELVKIEKILDDDWFKLHRSCVEILDLCITGSKHFTSSGYGFDKDTMHLALTAFQTRGGPGPSLFLLYDLWGIRSPGRWDSRRGFEYLVADPVPAWFDDDSSFESNTIASHLRTLISNRDSITATPTYISPKTVIALSSKVKADPFRNVPLEILFQIMDLLDNSGLFRLCSASWIVHSLTRTSSWFWRHRIRASMPWLTEIGPLLRDTELMSGVDAKGLLCGLNEETKCREGMNGPLMHLSNRRRIWAACECIKKKYDEAVEQRKKLALEPLERTEIDGHETSDGEGPAGDPTGEETTST